MALGRNFDSQRNAKFNVHFTCASYFKDQIRSLKNRDHELTLRDQFNQACKGPNFFFPKFSLDLNNWILFQVSFVFFYGFLSVRGYAESSQTNQKSKNWPTYGWSSKYDEPNVNRVNLAYQTPPNPSNFTWTVVARPGAKETSAQAFTERELVGLVAWKQVNFGKVIEPLAVRGFKHEIYYQFDVGGGEKMWLSGSNLKLSEKK